MPEFMVMIFNAIKTVTYKNFWLLFCGVERFLIKNSAWLCRFFLAVNKA
jgi:hypothetical protein